MPATTLDDRSLIRLSGTDVRPFLQSLVTNDVAGPLPVWAALLTPQGKCLHDFLVWADEEDVLLDCRELEVDSLIRHLSIYRLRRPITIERDNGLAVHWAIEGDDGVPDPRLPGLGCRWLGPADQPAAGWLAHRLRLGVCEGAEELGGLLWLECNAAELNGVDFSKGCFVGQENTARMNWRARVNRRLFVVEGDGGERARIHYPRLGLAVVHARVDAVPVDAIRPDWLQITA